MKKTYIIPHTLVVRTAHHLPLCLSGELDGKNVLFIESAAGEGEVMTKSNSYNVWDDDWSN